ncbi:hypothetical protein LYSIN_01215 [Lysinibacillus sphaericus]|uniref:Scaffolding protein n=1 Tax=Lysinibacillus sphaericus TaxID=1421 RepID=A0A2S5D095_LYSSH|nr:phage scaffolding protein [Lysinibacillus sphaericus]POZ56432.1 hypothetical protein LYSIN_01215 [Lysinibacillus sphaericus]
MNKEQLIALGLTEEQAQQILDGFGTMVPKSRLDDKIQELKTANDTIAERDTQLQTLQTKATGNEELQTEITRLQQENATVKAEHEAELQKRDFNYALDSALRDAKAKNVKAVRANLNLEAIKLDGDKLLGLDEQLTALKASDDYLFTLEGLAGRTPPNPPGTPPVKNPFSKDYWNLTEQGRLFREEPEKAKQLQALAGQ